MTFTASKNELRYRVMVAPLVWKSFVYSVMFGGYLLGLNALVIQWRNVVYRGIRMDSRKRFRATKRERE